ncbi:MAG: hypothetical protein V3W18_00725 [candidate division Zixibacteria bacterium]
MNDCREKKRLQIYLDGWMDKSEMGLFESHLRKCDVCQTALVEFEEVSAAALEIVDHAPEREYWDSFFARVNNRIISRDVSPYEEPKKSTFRIKLASYSIGIMTLGAALIVAFNLISGNSFGPDTVTESSINIVTPTVAETKSDLPLAKIEESITVEPEIRVEVEDSDNRVITAELNSSPSVSEPQVSSSGDLAGLATTETELKVIERRDYQSMFRGPFRITHAELRLSDDENFLTRLLAEYGGLAGDDFSISPNVVAEGILSSYASGGSGQNESIFIARSNGIIDPVNPNWGYLGIPGDSVNTESYRRYMIELDLTRTK